MNTKTKNILGVLVILGFIIFIIITTQKSITEDGELRANPSLISAQIVDWNPDGKGSGTWITYEFSFNSKKYKGTTKYYGINQRNNYLQDKFFPVIYSKYNPEISRLLILKRDFEEFNLTQPDSLTKYNDILE